MSTQADLHSKLDQLLEEKLEDPSQFPRLLSYAADYLQDWGVNRRGGIPASHAIMLLRCAKIMRVVRDHLLCEQSSEHPPAS